MKLKSILSGAPYKLQRKSCNSFYSLCRILDMTEATTTKQGALLEDSTFNVITQIEKKADFLYSAVEKYIRDAENDKKPELVKLWSTVKEDEQKHLKMLREELVKAVRETKLG